MLSTHLGEFRVALGRIAQSRRTDNTLRTGLTKSTSWTGLTAFTRSPVSAKTRSSSRTSCAHHTRFTADRHARRSLFR